MKHLLCHLFDQASQVNPDHLFLLSYPQVLRKAKKDDQYRNQISMNKHHTLWTRNTI